MSVTVFKEENVEFRYDSERKELFQKWNGLVKPKIFRKAVDEVLRLSHIYSISYIISDTTTHTSLSPNDVKYAADVTPQLSENGIKRTAFIVSESMLARIAANQFTIMVYDDMTIGHFSNIDNARAWFDEDGFH